MGLENDIEIAIATFRLIESGEYELAERIVAPDFTNREAEDDDQPERNLRGPAGFLATGSWLRDAFSDLRFEILDAIAQDGKVMIVAEMTGRQTGEFQGISPTGRRFRQRQMHLFELRAGQVVSHLAQRDDLGLLLHLGWRPKEGASKRDGGFA